MPRLGDHQAVVLSWQHTSCQPSTAACHYYVFAFQVGIHPKAYVYHNFLTNAERAHMIRVSAPQVTATACHALRQQQHTDICAAARGTRYSKHNLNFCAHAYDLLRCAAAQW